MAIELTTANNAVLGQIQKYTATGYLWSVFPNITKVSFRGGMCELDITSVGLDTDYGGVMDCQTLDRCNKVRVGGIGSSTGSINVSTITNASALTLLEDTGTAYSVVLRNCRMADTALNQFFTDLPSTGVTATIDVTLTNGAATCNTTIATSKGYTVITS